MDKTSNKHEIILTAQVPKDAAVYQFTTYQKHLKGKPTYLRFFTDMGKKLAKDKEINLTDHRVFLGLLAYTDFENLIDVPQQALANDLEIDRGDVAKSLKKLVAKGYLEVFATKGRQNIYRLNPYVAFKTRGKNLESLQAEFEPVE